MEEQQLIGGERSVPGEIVEFYTRPEPREVVEQYVRPLPGCGPQPLAQPDGGARAHRRKRTGLWIFLGCFLLVLLLSAAAWLWSQFLGGIPERPFEHRDFDELWEEAEPKEITIPTYPIGEGASLAMEDGHGPELTAQEVYRQVNPSVVAVMAQLRDGVSVGTGVIFSQDGYILTNYHVLEGGRDCTVALDSGRTYEAKYVIGDAENDLAVIKVDLTGLPAAAFGDSDQLVVGDRVYAIGNPLGTELRGTLTDGIVSAINRDVQVDGRTMTLVQTNAALNSGNSGGPLINSWGQVVGINTIKMSSDYANIEGLGFAIPSASIQRLINDLLAFGESREPTLGVSVLRMSSQVEEGLWGLEVLDVVEGSAAEKAGIQVGDVLLTAAGQELNSSQDLMRVRRQLYVGDQLIVTLWREGERLELTLDLEETAEE